MPNDPSSFAVAPPPSQPRAVDPLADAVIDWTYKGLAPEAEGLDRTAFQGRRDFLFDDGLFFPVAVLKESVLRANSAWMRHFIERTGAKIAPHGKTTMSPDLFDLQLQDGAWGISAATVQHVRAYRRFGIKRILLANQLVGKAAIRWISDELARDPEFEFFCLVDSIEGVEALSTHHQGQPIQVLIEVGLTGGRAGVRDIDEGIKVAKAAKAAPNVQLVGVETFEGYFQTAPNGLSLAKAQITLVRDLAQSCDQLGLFDGRIILTAGGSSYFDLVASMLKDTPLSRPADVVLRSGCYLTHDHGLYERMFGNIVERTGDAAESRLQPALQVWAHIQSIPEPGHLICGLGKRDVGADAGLPVIIGWVRQGERTVRPKPEGLTVTTLNDQHTIVRGATDVPLRVGDFIGFGVSHPCTTFDKWRAVLRVDDDYRVCDLARTYF